MNVQLKHPFGAPHVRGLIASKDIGHNAVVVSFEPDIKVLRSPVGSENSVINLCSACFEPMQNPLQCKCTVLSYCDSNCMRQDHFHYKECLVLSQLKDKNNQVDTFTRLVLRTYFACMKNRKLKMSVMNLTSHKEEILVGCQSEFFKHELERLTEVLCCNFQDYLLFLSCVCFVNSLEMFDKDFQTIGCFLDPTFSMINHSCIPNTLIVPRGRGNFSLHAEKDIQAESQITITYCRVNQPKQLRQFDLEKRFFFKCKCKLCVLYHDWYFAYNCPHCHELFFDYTFNKLFDHRIILHFPTCKSCSRPIDEKELGEINRLHKVLIGYLLCQYTQTHIPNVASMTLEQFCDQTLRAALEADLGDTQILEICSLLPHAIVVHGPEKTLIDSILSRVHQSDYLMPITFPLLNFFEGYCEMERLGDLDDALLWFKRNVFARISVEIAAHYEYNAVAIKRQFKEISYSLSSIAHYAGAGGVSDLWKPLPGTLQEGCNELAKFFLNPGGRIDRQLDFKLQSLLDFAEVKYKPGYRIQIANRLWIKLFGVPQ